VPVPDPSTFQLHLYDTVQRMLRIDRSALAEHRNEWFGDLADTRVGGANVILSHVRERSDGTVLVPNLALLSLSRENAPDALATMAGDGSVEVRAAGFSPGHTAPDALHRAGEFRCSRKDFLRAFSDAELSSAAYAVAFEIAAPIDPTVMIGPGIVFEQLTLNKTQNLAVATGATRTIAAGQIVPVILPAWCINRNLSPPSGQQMRLTRLRLQATGTQEAVWQQIESGLEAATLS
jgi:hypothetical protein